MIQLFIDGKQAVIKDETSFKLSLENNFFTKTSSYSFDVELPMDAPENRAIFGDLNRRDVAKEYKELSTKLLADNITILSGTVTITQVTESSIKVQLLGESAAYHYGNKADKLYIDELPLGNWYSRTFGAYPGVDTNLTGSTYPIIDYLANELMGDPTAASFCNWVFNNGMWVAYPIYNSEADTICNHYLWRRFGTEANPIYALSLPYATPNSGERNGHPQFKLAVQPFVWYMCELIAEATGYTLSRDKNPLYLNDFYSRIFLANANINIECNKCLPHWTVNEWWEQIEKTFGVTMVLNDIDNSLSLIGRDTFLNSAYTTIDNVIDEYSTDISQETSQEDIASLNVGFADNDLWSQQELISDELLEFVEIVNCDTIADAKVHFDKSDAFKKIYQVGNRHFILLGRTIEQDVYGVKEVNLFRPRIVDEGKNSIDIELKFIPCTHAEYPTKIVSNTTDSVGYTDKSILDDASLPVTTMLSRPDKANIDWRSDEKDLNSKAQFSLKNIIFFDGEVPEKEDLQDIAFIAIHSPQIFESVETTLGNLDYPRGWIHDWKQYVINKDVITETTFGCGEGLSLNVINGQRTLGVETASSRSVKIKTTIKHCFKFITDKIPNTSEVFVINNKKYLCEKLEVSISNKGIDKLITGYFYELS